MMPRSIAVILAVFLPAYAATAIDFTPHYMMEDADGIVVKRPYFTDGTVKYGIKFFADAVLTGQENAAIFKYSAFTYATMIWRSSPLTPRTPFDAAHLPAYAAVAQQFLPQGCAEIKVEAQEDNVFPINNWVCHRYTISYKFYGFAMRDTVTFLNLNDKEQFVIQVSARDSDFKAVAAKSWDVIRSWHEMVPELEHPVN